jgi:hypothetical protein
VWVPGKKNAHERGWWEKLSRPGQDPPILIITAYHDLRFIGVKVAFV